MSVDEWRSDGDRGYLPAFPRLFITCEQGGGLTNHGMPGRVFALRGEGPLGLGIPATAGAGRQREGLALSTALAWPRLFWRACWNHGIRHALRLALEKVGRARSLPPLGQAMLERFPEHKPSNAEAYLGLLTTRPLFSIVMPVFNSAFLPEAVASVLAQTYDRLELVLVDDGSTRPATLAALEAAARDPRVVRCRTPHNLGISGATNVGLDRARGEWVAFMDHDDLLHPDALACVVRAMHAEPGREADIFYADEAIINRAGRVVGRMRKCPVTLDLLLSCNTVLHILAMRRAALDRIGRFNPAYDGAQDHDLMLRALEAGLRFCHLPLALYAWRAHGEATSNDIRALDRRADAELPKSYRSGKAAIRAYLDRQGIRAEVTDDAFYWYRVKYALPDPPQEVAIVIPFKDQAACLRTLLDGLERTAYPRRVVYLVDNRSEQPETRALLASLPISADGPLRLLVFDEPFNYARLHNWAVAHIPNELILFLNNDIEIVRADWLEALLEHIHRPGVGAVGCRLVYPDGALQHGGMVFHPSILTCAINLHQEEGFYTRVQRDVSGVTAACMLVRKSAFLAVGGFDELQFPIAFNDSDLCLRLVRAGHKIMYTPHCELRHHHSRSRPVQEEAYEKFALFARHAGPSPMIDPHYPVT